MLATGQTGDWDEVVKLEVERRSLLTDSNVSALPQAGTAIADLLQEIIDINAKLTNLATAAKDASANELTRAQLGRRVVSAYQAVSE